MTECKIDILTTVVSLLLRREDTNIKKRKNICIQQIKLLEMFLPNFGIVFLKGFPAKWARAPQFSLTGLRTLAVRVGLILGQSGHSQENFNRPKLLAMS